MPTVAVTGNSDFGGLLARRIHHEDRRLRRFACKRRISTASKTAKGIRVICYLYVKTCLPWRLEWGKNYLSEFVRNFT